jgi:predicted nucleotide-binding protein
LPDVVFGRDTHGYLTQSKERNVALLGQAIESLKERLSELGEGAASSPIAPDVPKELSKRVFIVHGHAKEAKEAVARLLGTLGLDPIILHEQPMGRTVIEKFEAEGKVGFAVVLLTPDDVGNAKDQAANLNPRARQNVILELGYFVGTLGRANVCALVRGKVEVPSDFAGVVYETFDDGGAWKFVLGRELRAAGYSVDLNKIV